jgi:Skp family chaperone for outer membrane proteins
MSIIEDWYSLEESDSRKAMLESLQKKVEEQSAEIQKQSTEIQDLRTTITSLVDQLKSTKETQQLLLEELKLIRHTDYTEKTNRTNELLEELKIIKQRELNLLLREKIPIPFFASTEALLTKKTRL